mmetsp:Transcript_27837/g.45222  ORF Transcript_27837/g.45222 Transcript_27837/m.45222 type:complete len:101 (-) Transcript_27837:120-422(-)
MIEDFTILTKGGVVLWKKQFQQLKSNAINTLIKTVLLEDRGGSNSWSDGDYTLRWTFANELDLIFVVWCSCVLILAQLSRLYKYDLVSNHLKHCMSGGSS